MATNILAVLITLLVLQADFGLAESFISRISSFWHRDRSINFSKMRTANFVVDSTKTSDDLLHRLMSPTPVVSKDSPYLFSMQIYHVSDPSKILWQTQAGVPFIRSAVGDDSLTPGNGEYRVVQNNQNVTTHQTISFIGEVPAGKDFEGSIVDYDRIIVSGNLLYQANPSGRGNVRFVLPQNEPVPVLSYRMTIKEVTKNQLEMDITIQDLPSKITEGVYDRIIVTSTMSEEEEVFGLGEQFSFWTMKGQRVTILSREQGIGRGLQPITYILNHIPVRAPAYAGGDTLCTYTAIPHYITSQGRAFNLQNTELSFFDFSVKNQNSIEVVARQARINVFYGRRPFDLINAYTKTVSGRMKQLPEWIQKGAVIGIQGGQEKVLNVVKTLKSWGVKVAAVWLQDWVGMRSQFLDITVPIPFLIPGFPTRISATLGIRSTSPQKRLWWNWEHDRQSYPDWGNFIKTLREEYDVRVMSYINPFLSDIEAGGKPVGSFTVNYFKEASKRGYLVKRWVKKSLAKEVDDLKIEEDIDGHHVGVLAREMVEPQQTIEDLNGEWQLVDYLVSSGPGVVAGMIDLSNPEAFEWYKSLVKNNMLKYGVSGWMADFAEYVPFDGVLWTQRNITKPPGEDQKSPLLSSLEDRRSNPMAYHNYYPREWARLNREAVQEMGEEYEKDVVFFVRSASYDTPKFANAFWNGDQMHTYDHLDGLESTIYATLSSSMSGIAYQHSDIGGYTTLNVDPRVSIKIGNRTTYVKLPILERRARFTRSDKELFTRWMEAGAFMSTAMFRTHEGSVPDENIQLWQDEEIGKRFGFFTDVFTSLQGYRLLLQKEHTKFGYPPVRSLFLHYPHGNKGAAVMERVQFMLGPLITVIPITTPGIRRINEHITEVAEEPDVDQDEFLAEIKTTIRESHPQSSVGSSDDEDSEDDNYRHEPESAFSVKGEILNNIKAWAHDSFFMTLRAVFGNLIPVPPTQQSSNHGHGDKRWAKRNRKRPPTIIAPPTLPKPKHGRPFLPPGTWTHVWSKVTFNVQDNNGLYLTDAVKNARIPCPPGQPAVFIRSITEAEMRELMKRTVVPGAEKLKGGEDIAYWLDDIEDALDIQANSEDQIELLVQRGMHKYKMLLESLKPFLDLIEGTRPLMQTTVAPPTPVQSPK